MLLFPTLAEQAIAEFEAATRTDCRGRGKQHKYEAMLP